jgi:hypothetical protein
MAKKNTTIVSEMASAAGAAVARVENLKPKRVDSAKHVKAKSVAVSAEAVAPAGPVAPADQAAPQMSKRDEIAIVAYLYAEARGFQGGSPEENWLRAEQEVHARHAL